MMYLIGYRIFSKFSGSSLFINNLGILEFVLSFFIINHKITCTQNIYSLIESIKVKRIIIIRDTNAGYIKQTINTVK